MFRHACAFVDCAEACEKESNHIKLRTASHLTADIVNSSFACEIFLKTLLIYHGVALKTLQDEHQLNELWKIYKNKDKKLAIKIEESINNWFQTKDKELFTKLLNQSSNAFVYWRYIYEKRGTTINSHFLRGFRIILRETCCHKICGNSWKDYIELMKGKEKKYELYNEVQL